MMTCMIDTSVYFLPSSVTTRRFGCRHFWGESYVDSMIGILDRIQIRKKVVRRCRKIHSKIADDRYCSRDRDSFYYLGFPILNLTTAECDMKTLNACHAQLTLKLRCMIDIAYAPPSRANPLGGIAYRQAKRSYETTAAARQAVLVSANRQ